MTTEREPKKRVALTKADWYFMLPALRAEESTEDIPPDDPNYGNDYCGYTFYRFWTSKGPVVIRWQGSSSGYYGIGVDCYRYPRN